MKQYNKLRKKKKQKKKHVLRFVENWRNYLWVLFLVGSSEAVHIINHILSELHID